MSELEDAFVKRGYWIDHSRGLVMGQTLTVESQTGIIIVAILTILASVASAQLWNLCAFLIHQFRADGNPSDGLFWQQQALLRTMPTPTAFLADSFKLSWRWRSKLPCPLLRSSLLLVFAVCFVVSSIAGGISTSYVVDNSNIEVLVNGPMCGHINYTRVYGNQSTSPLIAGLGESIQSYVANCYQNRSSLPAPCQNTFSRPRIPFTTVPSSCPWNTSMCAPGETPAVAMDSGLLDMRTHFGLNVEAKDTVKFRRRDTCNVLPLEGRIFTRNASYWEGSGRFGDDRTTLEFGTYRNTPLELRPEATFVQSAALSAFQATLLPEAIMNFLLPDEFTLGIDPLPEMKRNDVDVGLIAVWLNDVWYEAPVADPLFSAHREVVWVVGGGNANLTQFRGDHAAGVIGCAQQVDFCTPLSGSPLQLTTNDFPDASPIQFSLLQLLQSISRFSDNIMLGPGYGNLLAGKTVIRGISEGLPDDQWIRELVNWERISWTAYQMLLSVSIIGPKVFDEFADEYREAPKTEGDRALCRSLKMRKAGGFANVNVFALVFIITFSTFITVFNMTVLRFFIFLSRFRRALAPRIDRWVQDGIFQLQRRAFEAEGVGNWVDLEKEVPVTMEREYLAELPFPSTVRHVAHERHVGNDDLDEDAMKSSSISDTECERTQTQGLEDEFVIPFLERMDSKATLTEERATMASITDVCVK
ncbi:hypothetical protein CC80DRAFT_470752 [Byssothecium circinans]|uniref:Uncharacterized protein n=1 Tax=Byssothecium circinans TaxID=147558 RepID=A0A6A5U0T6_9PLEO|nr:hypothetical protein CC80DRAFT_470752 [Byssothecium circinans]